MFEEPSKLLLGLVTGMVFGFLLQKGRAAKYHVILGQLLLKDWTVAKIMGTAVVVGAIGVYALVDNELASLHIKPFQMGGVLAGAVLFGIGMALLGYCPGTSVAACGEGRRDAMFGVLGMLTGATVFVVLFPVLQGVMKSMADWGKVTIPELLNVSPWLIVGALVIAAIAIAMLVESHWRGRLHTPAVPERRQPAR
jgi:uncharacterized protein